MGLNWRQFELGVLRPALNNERMPKAPALKLIGETIWHESDQLRALGQYPIGNSVFGPGLGIASIERPTWDWMTEKDPRWAEGAFYGDLAWDLKLNVWACRWRYYMDRRPLPKEDTIEARAVYWLQVYNGSGNLSRLQKYIADAKVIHWLEV